MSNSSTEVEEKNSVYWPKKLHFGIPPFSRRGDRSRARGPGCAPKAGRAVQLIVREQMMRRGVVVQGSQWREQADRGSLAAYALRTYVLRSIKNFSGRSLQHV